jgi:cytochrome P450
MTAGTHSEMDAWLAGACPAFPVADPQKHRSSLAPELLALQRERPVTMVRFPTGLNAWLVTRYADAREILTSPEKFSNSPGTMAHVSHTFSVDSPVSEGDFTRMDGEPFLRFRRAMGRELNRPEHLAAVRDMVERDLNALLDGLDGGTADLHGDLALPLGRAVAGRLFDLPESAFALLDDALDAQFSTRSTAEELMTKSAPLFIRLLELVAQRRDAPADDVMSRLMTDSRTDPPFTDTEVGVITMAVLTGGYHTTASVASLGVLALLERPERMRLLRHDPSLCHRAVSEMLRFLPDGAGGGGGIMRRATRDCEVGGQRVRAGDYLVVAVTAANRDPRYLPDADIFDISRPPGHHISFSDGPHRCIGEQIARLELEVMFETIIRRIPSLRLAVAPEDVVFRRDTLLFGPASLPVAWDEILP